MRGDLGAIQIPQIAVDVEGTNLAVLGQVSEVNPGSQVILAAHRRCPCTFHGVNALVVFTMLTEALGMKGEGAHPEIPVGAASLVGIAAREDDGKAVNASVLGVGAAVVIAS